MRGVYYRLVVVGCVIAFSSPPLRAQSAAELLPLLPSDANFIAIVQVADILKTPRAQKEQWSQQADAKFLAGGNAIPSWVNTLVTGCWIRPAVPEEVWSATIAGPALLAEGWWSDPRKLAAEALPTVFRKALAAAGLQ